jgi:hypothetical protein
LRGDQKYSKYCEEDCAHGFPLEELKENINACEAVGDCLLANDSCSAR